MDNSLAPPDRPMLNSRPNSHRSIQHYQSQLPNDNDPNVENGFPPFSREISKIYIANIFFDNDTTPQNCSPIKSNSSIYSLQGIRKLLPKTKWVQHIPVQYNFRKFL